VNAIQKPNTLDKLITAGLGAAFWPPRKFLRIVQRIVGA
jgi:hypothetical protein